MTTTSHPQNFLDADHLHLASYFGKAKQKQGIKEWSATYTIRQLLFCRFIVGELAAAQRPATNSGWLRLESTAESQKDSGGRCEGGGCCRSARASFETQITVISSE